MNWLLVIYLCSVYNFFIYPSVNADVTDLFDDLIIKSDKEGPFFPGDKVKFSCLAKKSEGNLNWFFKFDETSILEAGAEDVNPSERNIKDDTKDAHNLRRTSYIKIPQNAQQIACQWTNGQQEKKKFIQIDVQRLKLHDSEIVDELFEKSDSPQIVLQRFSPVENEKEESKLNATSLQPHLITNQTVWLPWEIKSFKLFCLHRGQLGDYNWTLGKVKQSSKSKCNPTVLLNNMALVQRLAVTAGRYPPDCHRKQNEYFPHIRMEVLEIIIPPLDEPQTTNYTCQGSQFSSQVTITFNPQPQNGSRNSEQDKELLDLINIVMQILQTSNESGSGGSGGSGPLVGVGFGSSTIMILMALTIYYLKRQLKQLQEQVSENDARRKLKPAEDKEEDIEMK